MVDSSRAVWEGCLMRRNGVAIVTGECSHATITGCRFEEQRVAHLCTLEPPAEVSIHAIDGGKTGYGSIQFPEYGVGDDEQEDGDTLVRWDDTHLALRDPFMRLAGNKGDDSAKLWYTPRRPGTLRGLHTIRADACECERVICKYGCEPECVSKDHKRRHRVCRRTPTNPLALHDSAPLRLFVQEAGFLPPPPCALIPDPPAPAADWLTRDPRRRRPAGPLPVGRVPPPRWGELVRVARRELQQGAPSYAGRRDDKALCRTRGGIRGDAVVGAGHGGALQAGQGGARQVGVPPSCLLTLDHLRASLGSPSTRFARDAGERFGLVAMRMMMMMIRTGRQGGPC